jgi:capsule synthesis protein PGA_cap
MSIKLALAGDTMVGATGGEELERRSTRSFFSPEVVDAAHEADLCILNLECCISARGERWPTPGKPFFFRAPPRAVEILSHLGVDCVNLANNHSLDYGHDALLDTFEHLASAGIQWVGAGADLARARAPALLQSGAFRLAVLGVADHPGDYGAGADTPGIAFADLRAGVPQWLEQSLVSAVGSADAVLFTPHWGPNFTAHPPAHVRSAAARLRGLATLIAGHSAHVVHGVEGNVLFDLGDFLEAYPGERAPGTLAQRAWRRAQKELRLVGVEMASALARRRAPNQGGRERDQPFLQRQLKRVYRLLREARANRLRGDVSLLFLVTLDRSGPKRLEALPLTLTHCHTRLAQGEDAARIKRRFRRACQALGTSVVEEGDRLVITWR